MEDDVGEATEEEINDSIIPVQDPTQQTQPITGTSNSNQNTPVEHELIIKLINSLGEEKELIIKYKE